MAASRGRNRTAAQVRKGMVTNLSDTPTGVRGGMRPKRTRLTKLSPPKRSPPSRARSFVGTENGVAIHAMMKGAKIRSPEASPSHQVSQMGPISPGATIPPSRRVRTPMVALTAVLRTAATAVKMKIRSALLRNSRPPA